MASESSSVSLRGSPSPVLCRTPGRSVVGGVGVQTPTRCRYPWLPHFCPTFLSVRTPRRQVGRAFSRPRCGRRERSVIGDRSRSVSEPGGQRADRTPAGPTSGYDGHLSGTLGESPQEGVAVQVPVGEQDPVDEGHRDMVAPSGPQLRVGVDVDPYRPPGNQCGVIGEQLCDHRLGVVAQMASGPSENDNMPLDPRVGGMWDALNRGRPVRRLPTVPPGSADHGRRGVTCRRDDAECASSSAACGASSSPSACDAS